MYKKFVFFDRRVPDFELKPFKCREEDEER